MDFDVNAEKIAQENDLFRKTFSPDMKNVVISSDVKELDFLPEIIKAVRDFDNFNQDNNPRGERNHGSFIMNGKRIGWEISYCDAVDEEDAHPTDDSKDKKTLFIFIADE